MRLDINYRSGRIVQHKPQNTTEQSRRCQTRLEMDFRKHPHRVFTRHSRDSAIMKGNTVSTNVIRKYYSRRMAVTAAIRRVLGEVRMVARRSSR